MFIKRDIDTFLEKRLFGGKALVIYGPRQSGKTTSVEHFLSQPAFAADVIQFDGEETTDRELLAEASAEKLKLLIGNKKIVFIDEAHKIPGIGLVLKRFADKLKAIQVIATGSSSEELAEKTEGPMTGRKFEYTLLPPSFSELAQAATPLEEMRNLERRMTYGSYREGNRPGRGDSRRLARIRGEMESKESREAPSQNISRGLPRRRLPWRCPRPLY